MFLKITFYISGWNVFGVKNKQKKKPALKKLLISQEMELSSARAKTVMFSFISGGNSQSCLTNKNKKFLMFI